MPGHSGFSVANHHSKTLAKSYSSCFNMPVYGWDSCVLTGVANQKKTDVPILLGSCAIDRQYPPKEHITTFKIPVGELPFKNSVKKAAIYERAATKKSALAYFIYEKCSAIPAIMFLYLWIRQKTSHELSDSLKQKSRQPKTRTVRFPYHTPFTKELESNTKLNPTNGWYSFSSVDHQPESWKLKLGDITVNISCFVNMVWLARIASVALSPSWMEIFLSGATDFWQYRKLLFSFRKMRITRFLPPGVYLSIIKRALRVISSLTGNEIPQPSMFSVYSLLICFSRPSSQISFKNEIVCSSSASRWNSLLLDSTGDCLQRSKGPSAQIYGQS